MTSARTRLPLLRLPYLRVTRTARAWIPLVGWLVFGLGLATAARESGLANGADRVLIDGFGAAILPLLAFAALGATTGRQSLSRAIAPVLAFGARRGRSATAVVTVAVVLTAVLGAALGAAMAILAHGASDSPAGRDAVASAYAGALGGAAYAAWFALGASFGNGAAGKIAFLLVDWGLGSTDTLIGAFTVRGNLRNLLGGVPPAALGERTSGVLLMVLAVTFGSAAIARASRT